MARRSQQEKSLCQFFILKRDKEAFPNFSYASTILNTGRAERLRLLCGTLLSLTSRPPHSGNHKIPVCSLDDENLEFDFPIEDVSPVTSFEKDLLIAITSRADRYRLYAHHNNVLEFGSTCRPGDWVTVLMKIDGDEREVAGVIRYKGELPTERGIRFGVELEEYRGAGVTDGNFRNHQLFVCQQDCGVFVSINKIRRRYKDYNRDKRIYYRTPVMYDTLDVDSALNIGPVEVGQRVCVHIDGSRKEGKVLYSGVPFGAGTEYVGIDLDDPITPAVRNNGVRNGEFLFIPLHEERTVLVPKAAVFPVIYPDRPGILNQSSTEPMDTSSQTYSDPFAVTVGSRVLVDNGHSKFLDGCVIWCGKPANDKENYVGVELDYPNSSIFDSSDGTFQGKKLFEPRHVERTVLVPALTVYPYDSSLSSETVKDSLNSHEANFTVNVDDDGRSRDHVPRRRHHSNSFSSSQELEYDFLPDVSDAISTSPGKLHSAPLSQMATVYGKAIDPSAVQVKTYPVSTSTVPVPVPTHAKYGQTSNFGASSKLSNQPQNISHQKDSSHPKLDITSRTFALTAQRRDNKSWTTNKFHRSDVDNHSRRKETEIQPSTDGVKMTRKTAKVKGQRTIPQDHGRVVSKFTLHDDVLNAVAMRIHGNWKILAENLGITNKEITQIVDKNSSAKDCALDMLHRWREQMSSSRDKLGPLIKACRKSDLHVVANELEQGLDEQRLHHIAGQVHESVWNVLGQSLGLEREHLSRLQMEDPLPNQRVYSMLLDWRLMQTFDSDKPIILAKALGNIGMDELAMEVCRGLTPDVLEHLSVNVKDFWKRLGKELNLTTKDLNDLDRGDDVKSGYGVILKWKRRQEPEGDLLSALSAALARCGRDSLAGMVVKGMDDALLEVIANMVEEKQHSIANALGIPMQVQFGGNDSQHNSKPSTLRLLQWWRANRALNEAQGQRKLFEVLMKYDFKDAADMVLPMSLRPETVPERSHRIWRMPAPRDLEDGAMLGTIAKMPCSMPVLAERLQVPEMDSEKIKKQWHDVNKQKFFLLRNWMRRNERIYVGNNLGWQLCKILLDMKMDPEADLLVPGSPANRQWFQETNFETFQENFEEENNSRTPAQYPQHRVRVGYGKDVIVADRSPEAKSLDLDIESVVEVKIRGEAHYGVIKSLNSHPNWLDDLIAGIELEEPIIGGTDGSFEGNQYFICGPGKAIFVYLSQCRPDSRFPTNADTHRARLYNRETSLDFGNQESPIISGYVEPQRFQQSSVGENKGIQGDQNSCYLDVTLYSMFSFNLTFDPLLRRPMDGRDIPDFHEIQTILREKIVNPLRQNGFVRADRVRDLRLHLDRLGLLPGMTNEEKDPEELLHMLVRDVLKAQPLIKTRHGDTEEIDNQYLYQIFMEKNDSLELPKVEQLLHQSFLDNELKLVEIPECLIVQMPRFGKDYKMYRRILPSLTIDITDLLENYPRECTICGELAKVECRDCRPDEGISEEFIKSYCHECCDMIHSSVPKHRTKQLLLDAEVEKGFELISKTVGASGQLPFRRKRMELFAVVCIQTSHYVAFVKTEKEPSHWVFFDSMADRDASSVPGFNIPKVTHLKDFETWLKYPEKIIHQPDDKKLPEHLRRLLGDAYICFYRRIEQGDARPPPDWSSGATNY